MFDPNEAVIKALDNLSDEDLRSFVYGFLLGAVDDIIGDMDLSFIESDEDAEAFIRSNMR